nr:unnamed protein product [Callosobruchus analis]
MLSCDGWERPIHHDRSNLSASDLKVMALRSKRMLRFYWDDCLTGVKLVPTLIKKVDDLTKEVEKLKNSPVPAITSADYEELLREMEDRNSRKQNIIIYNLPETPNLSKEEQAAADSQHIEQYKLAKSEHTRRQNAGEVNIRIKYIRGVPTIVSTN